ncbi:MAG: Thioesterase-like superfamily [Pseudomonadota bacterium]|jgi:acyl-CoA thioesterase FadM
MTSGYTHVHYANISFDLLDPANVLYHPNYLVLSDRARASALSDLGHGIQELWTSGLALAVRELSTEFLRPIMAATQVAILSQLVLHSARSITVSQRFVAVPSLHKSERVDGFVETWVLEDEPVLSALRAKLVCVSLSELRALPLPEPLASALQRLAEAPLSQPSKSASRGFPVAAIR